MRKFILREWLKPNFWKIKFPIEARASRVAILFIFNVFTSVSMMIIYDKTEGVPAVGFLVGLFLNLLTCYLFLVVTKHKQKLYK